jgi:RHS repeat-associated protein
LLESNSSIPVAIFRTPRTSAYYNNRLQPCRISVNSSDTALSSCTASSVGNILDISYNFNPGTDNGNVGTITNNIDNMRSQTFTYDTLNRLLTAQTNATYSTSPTKCWGEQYSYDPWGNLLGTGWPSSSYASCTQESPGPGGAVLANNQLSVDTYDAAGNMIAQGTCSTSVPSSNQYSYTYDAENHLVSETTASGANNCQNVTTSYTYDGDGNRVEKSSGTIYWHGAGGDALDESNLSGSITNEYIFFGGQRIARRDPSSNVFYNFSDHLGTARSIAEVPSGQTTATKCYDADLYPYGGERWYTDTCDSHFKFTGKERDPESGLDNFGARYNASSLGRFMSPDPLGGQRIDPQTLNKYSYVTNNPLRYTDPTGLYVCKDDPVDGSSHCASDDDKRFEIARQNDLNSKNADVVAAAEAYGKANSANGVTVGFADLGRGGEGGITVSQLGADANGNLQAQSDVTINSSSRGTALDADVGHEGSHVEDAQTMVKSITFDQLGNYKVGDDISQYRSEQRAYAITDAIYRSANEPYHGCASDECALGAGSSPLGIPGRIDAILLANPKTYHSADGKPLTSNNQGGNVLNLAIPH